MFPWLLVSLFALTGANCPTEIACDAVSCQASFCNTINGCGTYACASCGTGIIDRGDCNPTPPPASGPTPPPRPTPPTCDPAVWGNFESCSQVQRVCSSSTCQSGGSAYGKYTCHTNGCNGWYCPDPPCTQDRVCASIEAPEGNNLCVSLDDHCQQYGLGNLFYAAAVLDTSDPSHGGVYQCFRCRESASVTVPASEHDQKSHAGKDWPLVAAFGGAFIGVWIILYVPAWLASPVQPKSLPCRRKMVGKLGTLDADGNLNGCWYYFVNEHSFLRLTGQRDPALMSWNLALRESIAGFVLSFALSLVFAGIDTNSTVRGCAFDGRNGFTASSSTYRASGLGLGSFTMDTTTTVIVMILSKIVENGIGRVVRTVWEVTKPRETFVCRSLIIEITWLGILVGCLFVENRVAAAEVHNKVTVYFSTALAAKFGNLVVLDVAKLVGAYVASLCLLGGAKNYQSV